MITKLFLLQLPIFGCDFVRPHKKVFTVLLSTPQTFLLAFLGLLRISGISRRNSFVTISIYKNIPKPQVHILEARALGSTPISSSSTRGRIVDIHSIPFPRSIINQWNTSKEKSQERSCDCYSWWCSSICPAEHRDHARPWPTCSSICLISTSKILFLAWRVVILSAIAGVIYLTPISQKVVYSAPLSRLNLYSVRWNNFRISYDPSTHKFLVLLWYYEVTNNLK